jgi:copper(I)-binding protein
MSKVFKLCALLGALLLTASVYASDIQVESASARATAPGQDAAMVDLTIVSTKAAQMVGFSSPACKTAEMHSMSHDNGMMTMRQVNAIDLPAGKRVSLRDSGYHLMLIGLKAPLKAGERVPLTLTVKAGDKEFKIDASAEVKPLVGGGHEHMHH